MSTSPSTYRHGAIAKTGILLVNLGTPDEPTRPALRRYLKEFLWDPRVVEIPRPIWWFILNGIILNVRPAKSAKKYESIWMKEGSPLRVYSERQASVLKGALSRHIKSPYEVALGMRYGNPSIPAALDQLMSKGCDRVLVFPLYPQYAASTTASTLDKLAACLRTQRNIPAIRFIKHWHDHPAYIKAVTANLNQYWMKHGPAEKLLLTFHGLPRFHLNKGDPYHCECHKTARLIREELGFSEKKVALSFQSRFGKAEWLKPYTSDVLVDIAKSGVKRLDVAAPGFAADCLETLEEIADEGKEIFLSAGGKEFHYIPVANDSTPFVLALTQIALDNLGGWISESYDRDAAQQEADRQAARAKALGAQS